MTEASPSRLVYLDTNVFLRGLEGDPAVAEPIQRLFTGLALFRGAAVTRELTLAEVLAPAARKGAMPLEAKRRLYLDLIVEGGFLDLRPVTRDILIATAELRQTARLKLADAVHFATALQAGCIYFMSFDRDAEPAPPALRHTLPNSRDVQTVLDALHA